MPLATLNIFHWKVEVDLDRTRTIYSSLKSTGAESCSCSDCRNYVAAREEAFPLAVRDVLSSLGIDWRKDVEVFNIDAHNLYNPWFHFVGAILDPLIGPNDHRYVELSATTKISLNPKRDLANPAFGDVPLAQVEAIFPLPWVLNEERV